MSKLQQLIKEYKNEPNADRLRAVIHEIQTCEMLWAAYSPVTKGHYVDYVQGLPSAFLFSEKSYCEDFCRHMKKTGITVGSAKCDRENRLPMFSDFYRSGFEGITIDNGKNFLFIEMQKVVNPPPIDKLPPEQRPIFNRSLVCSANRFFQCLENKSVTSDKELNMLVDTYNAKYIIPMTEEPKDGQITIPALERNDGKKVVPFFTDINEYRKFDLKGRFKVTVAGYDQIETFCNAGETVVINPMGFNFNIVRETCEIIRRAHDTVAGADDSDRAVIYTPDDIPMTLINELSTILDRIDGTYGAYIKGLRKKGEKELLVVIDCGKADKDEARAVVEKVKEKAASVSSDRKIEYIPAESDIGRIVTKDTPPFFERIIIDATIAPDNVELQASAEN